MNAGCAVRTMWRLLRLPRDDPQLARLAAAAVLLDQERRCGACWSSAEMDLQRDIALRLEAAHLSSNATVATSAEGTDNDSTETATALRLAFQRMCGAVQRGALIPQHEELLVMVAQVLFKREFVTVAQVEEAVA